MELSPWVSLNVKLGNSECASDVQMLTGPLSLEFADIPRPGSWLGHMRVENDAKKHGLIKAG